MKKIFLISAIMTITVYSQAQKLETVSGKDNSGKKIKVEYYKGTGQDIIKSVNYELVNDLMTENRNKQNTINNLQTELNQAKRRLGEEQSKNASNSSQQSLLDNQVSEKESEIGRLNQQLGEKDALLKQLQEENERLRRQLDSVKDVNRELRQNISSKSSYIGAELGLGSVFLSQGNLGKLKIGRENPWERALSWDKQVSIYYGTGQLLEDFPLSVEAGLSFRNLPMRAGINKNSPVNGNDTIDIDNDSFQPQYDFTTSYYEKLTMNCLEIPIRVCYGLPVTTQVSVYAKLGLTPSFVIGSRLANGVYTKKGYYQDWDVTLENIEELGFFNDGGDGNRKVKTSFFNLWANAAVGAYIPLTSSMLFNVGAKLDFPIILAKGSENNEENNLDRPKDFEGLLNYNGRMLIPSLQAGIVYKLE